MGGGTVERNEAFCTEFIPSGLLCVAFQREFNHACMMQGRLLLMLARVMMVFVPAGGSFSKHKVQLTFRADSLARTNASAHYLLCAEGSQPA